MATSKRTALPKQVEEPADVEKATPELDADVDVDSAVVKEHALRAAAEPRTAYVGPSDTWGTLAAVHRVPAADLAAANGMTIHSYLYAGVVLRLPSRGDE